MIDPSIFNARDPRCKTPYGAVPSGTRVALTLRPRRAGGWSRAVLRAGHGPLRSLGLAADAAVALDEVF